MTTDTSAICGVFHVHGRNSTSGGSDGIPLMTKLMEALTLAGADNAAIFVHAHAGWISVSVNSRV